MSRFEIDAISYELIWASDVSSRDGIGCELWRIDSASEQSLLAEIFRDDTMREITFSGFALEIPLAAVERLLSAFTEQGGREFINY